MGIAVRCCPGGFAGLLLVLVFIELGCLATWEFIAKVTGIAV
tara:strand:- start:76 stop:201 length:126 start_codon:yes stop_codon:yes gene_type:complete